ncbi:MAG: CRISPR-associated protein Csx16 [Rhodocyclaceae bacterium]|nr:CRISPR-associated protein Csx16 [Rhodocyclaceae bacterium]
MTTFFISRHPGASEWAASQGLTIDQPLEHLDANLVSRGDVVIGTLPVHLVAEVNARGARYFHLTLDLPPELRGKELSAAELTAAGAKLEEYSAERKS